MILFNNRVHYIILEPSVMKQKFIRNLFLKSFKKLYCKDTVVVEIYL